MNEMELDVVRCRRNAMAYSAHPWSVLCALDSIKQGGPDFGLPLGCYDCVTTLGDFNFVKGVRDKRKSDLAKLPFVGPG